jgi:methionine-rich copper-binding protein CopC
MQKLFRLTLLAGSIALLSGAALRHNHLLRSSPGNGETLAHPPAELHLWFAERPELPFTSVTLIGPESSKLAVGKATLGRDSLEVIAPLKVTLAPGRYTATWRTASQDGHAARGRFDFTIVGGSW